MDQNAPYVGATPEETWWLYYWRATCVFASTGVVLTSVIVPEGQEFAQEIIELRGSHGTNVAQAINRAMKEIVAWKQERKKRV